MWPISNWNLSLQRFGDQTNAKLCWEAKSAICLEIFQKRARAAGIQSENQVISLKSLLKCPTTGFSICWFCMPAARARFWKISRQIADFASQQSFVLVWSPKRSKDKFQWTNRSHIFFNEDLAKKTRKSRILTEIAAEGSKKRFFKLLDLHGCNIPCFCKSWDVNCRFRLLTKICYSLISKTLEKQIWKTHWVIYIFYSDFAQKSQ